MAPAKSRVEFFRELITFGLVGGIGFVIDVSVFNLLRTTVFDPSSVHGGPVFAKAISTSLAIIANWIGNRYFTFRAKRRDDVVREGIEFAVVSAGGMGIALGCLWISHYLLGFTSLFADNIATNIVGLALGTAFRFALYRWWVYGSHRVRADLAPSHSNISSNTIDEWAPDLVAAVAEVAADGLEQPADSVVGVRA